MSQPKVTEDQMLQGVAALESRGEAVTKVSLRRECGNVGSYTGYQSFLARRRERLAPAQAAAPAPTSKAMPEAVMKVLPSLMEVFRAEAQAEVTEERDRNAAALAENDEALRTLDLQLAEKEAQLEDVTAKATQDLKDAHEKIAALEGSKGKAEGLAKQAEEDLRLERSETQALRSRLEQTEAARAALAAQEADLKAETLAAKNRWDDAQQRITDLSNSLAEARQQRDKAHESMEVHMATSTTWEIKASTIEAELRAANTRADAAEARIRTLESEHQVERKDADKRERDALAEVATLSKNLGILTGKAEAHAAEKATWESKNAALEARIRDLEAKHS